MNWRPPKRKNKKAWARVDSGDWLWDDKAVERAAVRRRLRMQAFEEYHRLMKRRKQEIKDGIMGANPLPPLNVPHKGNNR